MSDYYKGCWVAFDEDIKDEQAECLLNAIRYLKHVHAVEPAIVNAEDWMAREHVKSAVRKSILKLYEEI